MWCFALEVVFMGAIQIGAAVPPDAMLGALVLVLRWLLLQEKDQKLPLH